MDVAFLFSWTVIHRLIVVGVTPYLEQYFFANVEATFLPLGFLSSQASHWDMAFSFRDLLASCLTSFASFEEAFNRASPALLACLEMPLERADARSLAMPFRKLSSSA